MTGYPSRPLHGIGRHRAPVEPSWPVTIALIAVASALIGGSALCLLAGAL